MPINSFDNYPLTWKPEKASLKPPYYKALADDLEYQIRSGLLKPGAKLPPQREIADYLDLNYTTITRAYELCKKKGLIYGTTGKGTFVAPHASEDVTITADLSADSQIEMGMINGFSEYSELVEQATQTVIEKGYLRNLYEYSFPEGHPHQLAAGVRWMEQLGVHADWKQTAILSGGQNALTVALVSLFSPGDKIATDAFTYSNFIELAKLLHLVLIPVKGDENGMLPEELQKQCNTKNIKGVYLIPTCANPTAITIPTERRKMLAEVIQKENLILIEDDIATWMSAARGNVLPSLFDLLHGQSVYICGMTKSLCPGLRIAYMAFAERFQKQLMHGLVNMNIKTSSFDAEVITELILSGKAYEIANHKRELAARNCALFARYFPDFCPGGPEASYYRWLPVAIPKSSAEIERELSALGVRIYHSARFAVSQNTQEQYLRVSLCSAGSARRLERGLSILQTYIFRES